MRYNNIFLIILIIQIGCFNKESEKDLLNKVNPIGYYGNRISEGIIYDVDELLSSADNKLGTNLLLTGIITEVCPMRGCWLQVKDDNSNSSIRIKVTDGEIVFPLSAKGKNIIAKGMFTKLELSEKQAKNWKHHLALEKGIELDTSKIVLSKSDFYEYRLNSNSAKIF
jgi:hypothetical protein|tara:strand:- start:15 stop:518 length:504 start_codon:yes stop_codon:yes gene_type:complete